MSGSDPGLGPWRALRETFKVDRHSVGEIRPTTIEQLDRFEGEAGVRLPAGYRGYLQVFGPGCLVVGRGAKAREMFIRAPSNADPSEDLMRAIERNRAFLEDPPRHLAERTRRIIVFARNGLGDEFGWDPEDVTDPGAPEFGVYAWYRLDDVVKISDTFRGFIKFALDPGRRSEHASEQVYRPDPDESDLDSPQLERKRAFQP